MCLIAKPSKGTHSRTHSVTLRDAYNSERAITPLPVIRLVLNFVAMPTLAESMFGIEENKEAATHTHNSDTKRSTAQAKRG